MRRTHRKNSLKAYPWIAIMTIFVILAACLPITAAQPDTPSSWAQQEVDAARSKGLVISDADQNYQDTISRALFCRLVVNLVETVTGSPISLTISNPFEDTDQTDILKAYQLGIVNGMSETQFAPDDLITREQIAAMMVRGARTLDELMGTNYADVSDTSSIIFADQNQISSWALEDVKIASKLNMMKGVGENRINPRGNTTIEQSILLIGRLYDGFTALIAGPSITPLNHKPVPVDNPVTFSTSEQTALLIDADQLASDSDGESLTIIEINGNTGSQNITHGTALLTTNGKCSYTSEDINANVTDDFNVTITDGTNTVEISVRIHVLPSASIGGTPPVANADPYVTPTILEMTDYTYNAAGFASDADGDILRIIAVNGNTGTISTACGTALLNSNGTMTYTSRNVDSGITDTFTITISDGLHNTDMVVKIPILPIPDTVPQAISNPVVFSVSEQDTLIIAPGQLASDADGDSLSITQISTVQLGTAAITTGGENAGSLSYTAGDITENKTEIFQATLSDGSNIVKVNVQINITANLDLILHLTPTISSVSVNGTAAVDETLSVGTVLYFGIPASAPSLSYLWLRSSAENGVYEGISGATGASYQIPASDLGKYFKVKVTANGTAQGAVLSAPVGPVQSGFAGGTGSFSAPYQIASARQFMLLNVVNTAGKYFELISDIQMEHDTYIKTPFYGILNGNGHTVTIDLNIPEGEQSGGLFGYASSTARISDLTVAGSIESLSEATGGIVGYNVGTILRCMSDADISGQVYTGGITGKNKGTIEQCGVSSDSIAGRNMLGGIAGVNFATGVIKNCYSHADIYLETNAGGGLIGWNEGSVRYCYSKGMICDGLTNKGGLVGYNNGGTISASYYDQETSGRNDTGKGIPKTTSEMKTPSTFSGWDYTTIWFMSSGQYPRLR